MQQKQKLKGVDEAVSENEQTKEKMERKDSRILVFVRKFYKRKAGNSYGK